MLTATDSAKLNISHVEARAHSDVSISGQSNLEELPLVAAFKSHSKQAGYLFLSIPLISLFGFDGVIVSTLTAIPSFQQRYGQLYGERVIIPARWLSVWTAAVPIGAMLGALIAGWCHDRLGRRASLVLGSCIGSIGIAICFGSHYPDAMQARRSVFLLGKLLEGLCIGQTICTTQTYVSEIMPQSLKGFAAALFPVSIIFGQLLAAVVVVSQLSVTGSKGYLTCIATQWALCVAAVVAAVALPESPIWLLRQKRIDAARKAQRRLERACIDSDEVIDRMIIALDQDRKSDQADVSYKKCFTGPNLQRTIMVVFANSLPHFAGSIFLANGSYILQLMGMNARLSIDMLLVNTSVGLVSNIVSTWTMSRCGRRPLAICTFIIAAGFYLLLGISGFWHVEATLWITVATFLGISMTVGIGVWPVSIALASEISSLPARGKTLAIGWIAQGLITGASSIFLPYIFSPDAGNAGGKTGFLYTGLCLIAAAIIWLYVPEMKGLTAAQIDHKFEGRMPARKWHVSRVDDVNVA